MKWTCSSWLSSVVCLTGSALLFASACSSAQLDPNTRAITFVAPYREASGGTAPEIDRDGQPQKSPRNAGSSLAGAGGSGPTLPLASAGAASEPSPKPITCSELPDPVPTLTNRWTTLTVRFDKGTLELVTTKAHRTRRAEASKRKMGRFVAELWIGCELIDRVRFDFPLLVAKPAMGKSRPHEFAFEGPFETTVVIPDSERATRLELVDRDANSRRRIDWPPRAQ